jgi:Ca2+-binding RTX toxin-like protein
VTAAGDKISTFNAPLLQAGTSGERVNSLQDDDVLVGGGTANVLNATLGVINPAQANDDTITPTLTGIQTINVDTAGTGQGLDLRFATGVTNINVNRVTADAGDAARIVNISQPVADLAVKNSSGEDNVFTFDYAEGVLGGTTAGKNAESVNLGLTSVIGQTLKVGNTEGFAAGTEGFETVRLTANGTSNVVRTAILNDLEVLTISGTSNVQIANLVGNDEIAERELKVGGSIQIGDGIGIRTIDSTALTGNLTLDLTNHVQLKADPNNTGAPFNLAVKAGAGNDRFLTRQDIATEGTQATVANSSRFTLDGGAGNNSFVTYGSIFQDADGVAAITNVQQLEVRDFVGNKIDIDAFDSKLARVVLRNETFVNGDAVTVRDITTALATGANSIELRHPTSANIGVAEAGNKFVNTVNLLVKDASGADDTLIINVRNDLNRDTQFNYTLNIDGVTDTQAVENIVIDETGETESNVVVLSAVNGTPAVSDHTKSVTLRGGEVGDTYTVNTTLIATTVDAGGQLSDLRLQVGAANQTIRLGAGNDILTFQGLDTFNGSDTITDAGNRTTFEAGGGDTVRAAFSKDVTGTPSLTGVERFHIVSTERIAIDLGKAQTVQELAFLSDKAVDNTAAAGKDNSPITDEPFGITGVDIADIVTLNNTALSTLNFFADNDTDDVVPTAAVQDSESPDHVFNGVTLSNNSVATLAVAINSSLDVADGAKTYSLGQITANGVKDISITVANDVLSVTKAFSANAFADADARTTIDNLRGTSFESVKITATGDVVLGTVSGNATNNNIKSFVFDSLGAGKSEISANIIALGDAAVVTLDDGDDVVSGLASSGRNVVFNAAGGNNNITGTAQSDTINALGGDDFLQGDRGDNVISSGAGDDVLTGKDGNDTYSVGSGFDFVTDNFSTDVAATKATTTVTGNGTIVRVLVDVDGDKAAGVFEVNQYLAVGLGSDLNVSWTGNTLNSANAVLNGTKSVVGKDGSATVLNGSGVNSDLVIFEGAITAATVSTGGSDDVVLVSHDKGGNAVKADYTVSLGAGNDAFVGGDGKDLVTGGLGSDLIVLSGNYKAGVLQVDTVKDVVSIADGDSVAAGLAWDRIVGFDTATGLDQLDLVLTAVAIDGTKFASLNVIADITTDPTGDNNAAAEVVANVVNGVLTFTVDADGFRGIAGGGAITVGDSANQISVAEVLSFLATNLNNTGLTVGFAVANTNGLNQAQYDVTGALSSTLNSFVVFQDGQADTVVELVGNIDVSKIDTVAAANTVVIV